MAAPVVSGSGLTIQFQPPIAFILKQAGAFRRSLDDLIPLWVRFGRVIEEIEEEQFDTHGHGAWPGLAESTLEQKSKHGWPGDPLIRTGALKDSLTSAAAAADYGPDHMIYGTDVEYAHWHQDGGYVANRPPQRKVLDLTTGDRQRLEHEVVSYVNEAAALTFGRI